MLKVLHAPVNVGNQPWGLSQQERLLGIKSELITNYSTWLGYPSDRCLSEYGRRTLKYALKRLWVGLSAPFRYDVLHYYFGRSLLCWDDYGSPNFLWFLDMKIARKLGKKVFLTLQGCDVRLAKESDMRNEVTMCREGFCKNFSACLKYYDQLRITLIKEILPYCNRVFYLNPELGHFLSVGVFLPYSNVDVEKIEPTPPSLNGTIRILHAPTDGSIKGTPFIQAAVDHLKKKYPVEFLLVQNLPHKEAMKVYRDADIVIEQTLAGWYGGFAVEMMAMGKPVISYIRQEDLNFIPPAMREELPIISTNPAELYSVLVRVIEQRPFWPEWSRRARDYVLRWHNPRLIARAMIDAYRSIDSLFDIEHLQRGI